MQTWSCDQDTGLVWGTCGCPRGVLVSVCRRRVSLSLDLQSVCVLSAAGPLAAPTQALRVFCLGHLIHLLLT